MRIGFGKGRDQSEDQVQQAKHSAPTGDVIGNAADDASANASFSAQSNASAVQDDPAAINIQPETDLTKLKKKDLLEIMLRQGEEIDALRAEVADLREQLESRQFQLSKVGSIAEASLAVTDIFKEADKAAMTYLANLKRIAEEGVKK